MLQGDSILQKLHPDGRQGQNGPNLGAEIREIELGQDMHVVGGDLTESINEGVRQGYRDGSVPVAVNLQCHCHRHKEAIL